MHEQRAKLLAGILAASETTGGPRAECLSMAEGAGVPSDSNAILDRMTAQLEALSGGSGGGDAAPPDTGTRAADEPARKRALDLLLAHAEPALQKIKSRDFSLGPDELCAMEAIIIADGSRPSFLLSGGRVAMDDPFVGEWEGSLVASRDAVERVAKAVGRIQPAGGNASYYIGSGTLVDRAERLVLTNFHVIEQARTLHGIAMHDDGGRLVVEGDFEIDFAAESGVLDTRRFRIAEVRLPEGAGAVFGGIDAAVCRLEPLDDGVTLPDAVRPLSPSAQYATGEISSMALIGFPGEPAKDKGDKVDWNFVIAELLGRRFGVKRLAPGRFRHGLGTHPLDTGKRAIGHDATTFGGASGALVVAWLDDGAPGFALHFGGETVESNYALSFAKARAVLEPLGVPFG
jgi:hypothetical protein